jgi:hypothetical protein
LKRVEWLLIKFYKLSTQWFSKNHLLTIPKTYKAIDNKENTIPKRKVDQHKMTLPNIHPKHDIICWFSLTKITRGYSRRTTTNYKPEKLRVNINQIKNKRTVWRLKKAQTNISKRKVTPHIKIYQKWTKRNSKNIVKIMLKIGCYKLIKIITKILLKNWPKNRSNLMLKYSFIIVAMGGSKII